MSKNYFINKVTNGLSAHTINDFVQGLKEVVEQGGSIGNPNKAFKAGSLYHAEVFLEIDPSEEFLTAKALQKELDSLNSKNKVAMFARKVYNLDLEKSIGLEEMKAVVIEHAFPTPRKTFEELENIEEQVDWFREEETAKFDHWAAELGIKIDGRLTLEKMKKSFWDQYNTSSEEQEPTEEVYKD